MDKKGLERLDSNLDWLAENGGKLSLKEWFTKMFNDTDATVEDVKHFSEVIKEALIENKELKELNELNEKNTV